MDIDNVIDSSGNILRIGDRVEHLDFPPIIGTIQIIQPLPNNRFKIGVLSEESNTIFYDYSDTWAYKYYSDDGLDMEIVSIQ